MTTHKMSLKKKYFDLIFEGKKTIELRLFDDKRQKIRPGDKIEFANGDDSFVVDVKGLIVAKTFEELFNYADPQSAGFESVESALNVMEEFYPRSMQEKIGVVGILVSK